MNRIALILCLSLASALFQPAHPAPATSPHRVFENQYLRIRLRPGWTVTPPSNETEKASGGCCTVFITHGEYVLAVNPVFEHASGVTGGRMNEILGSQPSVQAVVGDDDLMDIEVCLPSWDRTVNKTITLRNLYLDPSKMSKNCTLPHTSQSVWFASYDSGERNETEYSIALTCNSTDVNKLPRKDSPELREILNDVTRMLRTLRFKPLAPAP